MPASIALPCRPPYDWPAMRDFLAGRAIPGIEAVGPDRYARTIAVAGRTGSIAITPGGDGLVAIVTGVAEAELPGIAARLRRLFDCDADPAAIGAHLATDPRLGPLVAARPGLRVPGAWDGFELGVRAILGQQVSVAAATQLAGRLVAELGTPLPALAEPGLTHVFPTAERVAAADVAQILTMPRARGAAIRALAAASLAEPDPFALDQDLATAVARLTAIRGIGPWTAQYIAMRALRAPDAFPPEPGGAAAARRRLAPVPRLRGVAPLGGRCGAASGLRRTPCAPRMPAGFESKGRDAARERAAHDGETARAASGPDHR